MTSQASLRERAQRFFSLADRAGATDARRLHRQLIRNCGTLTALVLALALVRLALPAAPALPFRLGFGLAAPMLVASLVLWVLPWERLPGTLLLPLNLLAFLFTAALIVHGRHNALYGLFFIWIGFAATAYPFLVGLGVIVLMGLFSLGIALVTGDRAAFYDQLVVMLPFYLLTYILMRQVIARLYSQVRATSRVRGIASRLALLYDFSTLLSRERDRERLMTALVEGLAYNFGYRYVSAFLLEEGRLRLMAQVGYTTPLTELALGEGITGLVAQRGEPLLVRDGREHPSYLFAEEHFGSQASAPLLHDGRVLGVLNLEDGVGVLTEDDLRLLEALAAPAAVALENAALLARLEDQAHRDPLTGLPNRRGIIAALEAALPRAGDRRAAPADPVTILLVDLNGFKAANDRYGHAVGDLLLMELASLLAASVRAGDTVGRLGGDEFLIVMPGADGEAAAGVVERLTAAIAVHSFPIIGGDGADAPELGYSLGLATAPDDGLDAEALLLVADRAMYRAKRGAATPIRFLAPPRASEQAV